MGLIEVYDKHKNKLSELAKEGEKLKAEQKDLEDFFSGPGLTLKAKEQLCEFLEKREQNMEKRELLVSILEDLRDYL